MKEDFKRENSLKKKKDGDEIAHEQMLKSYQIANDDEKKAKEEKDEK